MTVTCATPGVASTRRRTSVSAVVRSSSGVWASDCRATNMISPMIDDSGAITGTSMSSGSVAATVASLSLTVCRASRTSAPQSKSTQTTAMPTAVDERTRRTPDAPFRAASRGKVTSASMSVGAIP